MTGSSPSSNEASQRDADRPFQPLRRAATLSDRVTQEIRDHIIGSRMRPGDRMPSERDLGLQFNVSRTVVREAMRSLAAEGVLRIQSGSPATVARVGVERVGEAMRLYVHGLDLIPGGVSYEQINDVRDAIESRVTRLAAAVAGPEDLAKISSIHQAFIDNQHDPEMASELDVHLHRAIAESAQNPLFVVMLDSIEPILLEIRRRTLRVPGRTKRAIASHALIIERILAGDPDGAEQAMIEHLEESLTVWRSLAAPPSSQVDHSDAGS